MVATINCGRCYVRAVIKIGFFTYSLPKLLLQNYSVIIIARVLYHTAMLSYTCTSSYILFQSKQQYIVFRHVNAEYSTYIDMCSWHSCFGLYSISETIHM